MEEDYVSPIAQNVIAKCGGVKNVADICGTGRTAIYKWTYPKTRGGTGGTIPHYAAELLLGRANDGDFKLSPGDFFETKVKA